MEIVIIGGGGFIGTALRKYFSEDDVYIHLIGRKISIPVSDRETYYSVSEYTFKQLSEMFRQKPPDLIIDLAYNSTPGTSYDDPVKDYSDNLYQVIQHLEFAKAVKTGCYIYVSSGGTVYGDPAHRQPLGELAPNYPLSPYGVTKMACERYVYMYHRMYGLPAIILRPSNIYGPGQKPFIGQGIIATAIGLAIRKEPVHIFGTGSHIRDYIFIDDFCAAVQAVICHGTYGETYNMGSGAGTTIVDLMASISLVLETSGLALRSIYLPGRPFDVQYNVLNIDKIKSISPWQPGTGLTDGIQKTFNWIKEQI